MSDEKLAVESERESLLNHHQIELANERGKSVMQRTALRKEADSLSAEIESKSQTQTDTNTKSVLNRMHFLVSLKGSRAM